MAMSSLITIIQIWNSLRRTWQKRWSLSGGWWLSASSFGWVWQRQRIPTASTGPSGPLTYKHTAAPVCERAGRRWPGLLLPCSGVLPRPQLPSMQPQVRQPTAASSQPEKRARRACGLPSRTWSRSLTSVHISQNLLTRPHRVPTSPGNTLYLGQMKMGEHITKESSKMSFLNN